MFAVKRENVVGQGGASTIRPPVGRRRRSETTRRERQDQLDFLPSIPIPSSQEDPRDPTFLASPPETLPGPSGKPPLSGHLARG